MGDHDVAIAGFYDHEEHEERRTPDWGGDDLFTGAAPRRRRFERGGHPGHPVRSRDTGEHRVAPHRERDVRPAAVEPVAAEPVAAEPVAAEPVAAEPVIPDRYLEPVPEGRRTVTITGRPERAAVARRPSRTLDDRLTHRPERILSWTCAMGVLLILLAVLTAH